MENELFVPYRQSLYLEELGFNEPCFGYFDRNHNFQYMYNSTPENFTEKRMGVSNSVWVGWISAPLYSQAFKFFRDKHKLEGSVNLNNSKEGEYCYYFNYISTDNVPNRREHCDFFIGNFKTYEEAELECLKKLIEVVKDKDERE